MVWADSAMACDREKEGSEAGAEVRPGVNAGLCGNCLHARRIESARGSSFLLCGLSAIDPSYAKYPRLPVLCCAGYEAAGGTGSEQ